MESEVLPAVPGVRGGAVPVLPHPGGRVLDTPLPQPPPLQAPPHADKTVQTVSGSHATQTNLLCLPLV